MMGMLTPRPAPDPNDLDAQRKLAHRAKAAGRHWVLRGVLLVVIAIVGFYRGGSLMTTIGVVCLLLALMSVSLGAQTRRQAKDLEEKLKLMGKQ